MRLSALQDRDLVHKYLEGNESAFEALLLRHKNKVFTHIYIKVKDRDLAEDIFQDTFIKVVNTLKAGKYNEEGKFLPWLMRIAHNLVIDHFRRNKKMPKVRETEEFSPFAILDNGETAIDDVMISDQIHEDVKSLVKLLPEEQREVVIMRHYKGMSFKDIAEATNVSINTALGRMRYALINMRKIAAEKDMILTVR
ncbi:MAG: sigma-70 family RNA polymerase sigma factor [Flavobacteriales bacterium]|nr:sigma-70 family RNA polymerase sigma factor [Flavobacteriales bacterium]